MLAGKKESFGGFKLVRKGVIIWKEINVALSPSSI